MIHIYFVWKLELEAVRGEESEAAYSALRFLGTVGFVLVWSLDALDHDSTWVYALGPGALNSGPALISKLCVNRFLIIHYGEYNWS